MSDETINFETLFLSYSVSAKILTKRKHQKQRLIT